MLNTELQLSYFFTLRAAQQGGKLAVYSTQWLDPHTPWLTDRGIWDTQKIINLSKVRYFKPNPGDLLIFNGGNFYPRVTKVDGDWSRWTYGGFLAQAKNGDTVYWN